MLWQVLVSIQGLILVAEPYYNEAGYEKQVHLSQSPLCCDHLMSIDLIPAEDLVPSEALLDLELGSHPDALPVILVHLKCPHVSVSWSKKDCKPSSQGW